MSTLTLSTSKPSDLKVDALVVGVVKGARGVVLAPGAEDVDKAFKGRFAATVEALGGTGKAGEVTKIAAQGQTTAPLVVAVGLGDQPEQGGRRGSKPAPFAAETLRRASGAASRALAGCARVGLALPTSDAASVEAVAEGALLGAYGYHRYRVASKGDHKPPVGAFTLLTAAARDREVRTAAEHARVVSAAVNLTRDWVNTPPSDLPPAEFAAAAVAAAKEAGLTVEVLDEKALRKEGYGGILGVGQGSSRPPRLVRLTYTSRKAKRSLALVGKGITFDSGGLSLKPSAAMEWMKSDMGGAAAVIAAMTAIARLKPEVNVTGWAPMAENMPSGTAQRPSDVLTIYGGRTVEVLNTDAEGRLILADAIARASEDKPDLIVDIATLTGAQLVALGSRTAAIMSNSDDVRAGIAAAAERAGEQMWPMPLPEELRKSMDSEVADIANMGDKYGGMLVAGLFLKDFVGEGLSWAHLDIAGPAFNESQPHGYTPKGGTGAGVRTLVRIAEDVATGTL
ncbi:MAG: leucyl aminopeptidase [Actinomycetota bacterium]|nr:leucyl aminopeptidase [Actinomycetota bacterium]MDQ1643714.1 leucyl aminopeptidase [Actinomycetota bacterium]